MVTKMNNTTWSFALEDKDLEIVSHYEVSWKKVCGRIKKKSDICR